MCTFSHEYFRSATAQIMKRAKVMEVVFAGTNFTTSITALDDSLSINDVLQLNGLLPRDGTFRYISSSNGTMMNHMPVRLAPNMITVQNPKNIVQVWIDSKPHNGRVFISSDDEKYCIYGAVKDNHANVFLTRWKIKNVRCGYTFSPNGAPYEAGMIVFLRVPMIGNQAGLFNPLSGGGDYPLRLEDQHLESMRGFWSAWEIQANVNSATFRADLTPIPAEHKPPQRKTASAPKSKTNSLKDDPPLRRIKMKSLKIINAEPSIHSCQIPKQNHSRKVDAIVCGVAVNPSSPSNIGFVAAWGNKTRPTMINQGGYRYGMSHFVKIPDEGRDVQIYNSVQNTNLSCRLTDSPGLQVDDLRGRWVVAQLRRHREHKRILKLYSMPSDVV